MNSLHETIVRHFKIDASRIADGKWIPVRCPYHNDSNASAGLIFDNFGGHFNCMANCPSKSFQKLAKELKLSYDESTCKHTNGNSSSDDGSDGSVFLPDTDILGSLSRKDTERLPVKVTLTDRLDLLERFISEKGITLETIKEFGGTLRDSYLVFTYGYSQRKIARYLGLDKTKERFLNSSGENKGFLGEESIEHYNEIILCEGLTDFLSLWQLGYRNIICSFGASLSEEQAYLLRNKTVFILFDRDFAGYKGSKEAEEKLRSYKAIPITLELYKGITTGSKKFDVNLLCNEDSTLFKCWLDGHLSKYSTFDGTNLEEYKKNRQKLIYYNTDITILRFTEGLYAFTGPPGTGKTTMAISFIEPFVEQGGTVLYCNYDLPRDQIIARIASRNSKYGWAEIEENFDLVKGRSYDKLKSTLNKVKIVNGITSDEIKHSAIKTFSHIIVDNLQRMPSKESDSKKAIDTNLAVLADLSTAYGKTVALISRMGGGNALTFTGSSAIESVAQATVQLERASDDIITCNVTKNTRGLTGVTYIRVNYPHQRIEETDIHKIKERLFEDNKI